MTVTTTSFLAAYPEFSSGFSPDAVSYNLGLSSRLLDPVRWGELYDDGIMLLTAHNLAMAGVASSTQSSPIGAPVGVVSSKSVGSVSKSIDTSVGRQDGAGLYDTTSYGRRYYQLLRMIGAGGVQLGACL